MSFHDNKSFLCTIDSIPGPSAKWKLIEITIQGSELDTHGKPVQEIVNLWARDPVKVVADLTGNPHFKGKSSYEPMQVVLERDGPDAPEICFFWGHGHWGLDVAAPGEWTNGLVIQQHSLQTIVTPAKRGHHCTCYSCI